MLTCPLEPQETFIRDEHKTPKQRQKKPRLRVCSDPKALMHFPCRNRHRVDGFTPGLARADLTRGHSGLY